ncbi:MAG: hypothetical protein WC750_01585 [Patescibacteria group bacterium]|jgi:hypothetical protein
MFIQRLTSQLWESFQKFCVLFFGCCVISIAINDHPETPPFEPIGITTVIPGVSSSEARALVPDLMVQGIKPAPSVNSSSPPPIPDPPVTTCFNGKICDCEEHGKTCFDVKLRQNFLCSYGLVLTMSEQHLYNSVMYRNACRPRDWPALKACKIGESCTRLRLTEGQACIAEHETISTCHCGVIIDFSTPELRMEAPGLDCEQIYPCADKPEVIEL